MATLAATSSLSSSLQLNIIRQRLESARQEESRAESEVNRLHAQTQSAESELQKRRDDVSRLSQQNNQSDPTYQSSLRSPKLTTVSQPTASALMTSVRYASGTGLAMGSIVNIAA